MKHGDRTGSQIDFSDRAPIARTSIDSGKKTFITDDQQRAFRRFACVIIQAGYLHDTARRHFESAYGAGIESSTLRSREPQITADLGKLVQGGVASDADAIRSEESQVCHFFNRLRGCTQPQGNQAQNARAPQTVRCEMHNPYLMNLASSL